MRTNAPLCRTLLFGILAFGISAGPAVSQDASSQIRGEIARLDRAVSSKPDSDPDWKGAKPSLAGALADARLSLAAGRLYRSLEELERARTSFRALESGRTAPKNGAPGFDAAWKKTSLELAALDGKALAKSWGATPAAIRAVAETAEGRARVLLDASRAYAGVTSVGAGFYYIGEAKAAAESASYCSTLHAYRQAAPLPLRPIAPELRQLQERTVAAFKPPRSIERHGDFISLNATLKLAGELDAAKLYAGALYQYLDAVQQFKRLDFPVPDPARQSALRGNLAALHTRLANSKQDDSIAELFLERTEGILAGRNGSAPSPDDWKNAAVIAEQVLPAYFAFLTPAPSQNLRASHTITVTLVRWPYT
ncbi:MAG: hypothetical protein QOJ16_188 [Acidobacteriota bacterium]|nr:hypothetical protein [Acidobacteriota bacterium]